jgi:hypothetical protein
MVDKEEVKVTFGPCCFCGISIETTGVDPCRVIVEPAAGGFQVWSCHAACFTERLVPDHGMEPGIF